MNVVTPIKPNGGTYRITVPATASTPLLISHTTAMSNGFAALVNTGTAIVSVSIGQTSATTLTPVEPTTGTSFPTAAQWSSVARAIVLPPSMNYPIIIPVPPGDFYVSIIGSAANGVFLLTPIEVG